MNSFLQDLRYGLRSLLKSPGFTAVAVLTLALGVGANTAIFSVLRAVVLRDLPYHDPDRIAVMWTRNIRQNLPDGSSYLNFRDWKEQSKSFEQMAAYIRPEFTRGTLAGGGGAERIFLAEVGPGFFELLGTPPLIGRTFEPGDFSANRRAVIISHGLWRQRFGADRGVHRQIDPAGGGDRRDRRRDAPGVRAPERGDPALAAAVVRPGLAERAEPRMGCPRRAGTAGSIGDHRVGARRNGCHCGPAARTVSRVERELRRDDRSAGRSRHRTGHGAFAVAALRIRRVRPADCLRERGEPRARSRGGAPPRVLAAHGPRRGQDAARAAGADRKPGAVAARGNSRPADRLVAGRWR